MPRPHVVDTKIVRPRQAPRVETVWDEEGALCQGGIGRLEVLVGLLVHCLKSFAKAVFERSSVGKN